MAARKTEEEIREEKTAAEVPAAEAPADPWEETVDMVVPRRPKGDDQRYYICVNDRRFYVPADGKKQSLPRPVAEILQASLQAAYEAEDFAEEMSRKAMDAARSM